jgi:hypothetical protein
MKRENYRREGYHWWNDGAVQKFCVECPKGFKKGRLYYNNSGNCKPRKLITFTKQIEFKSIKEAYEYLDKEGFFNIKNFQNFKYRWNNGKEIITGRARYISYKDKYVLIEV